MSFASALDFITSPCRAQHWERVRRSNGHFVWNQANSGCRPAGRLGEATPGHKRENTASPRRGETGKVNHGQLRGYNEKEPLAKWRAVHHLLGLLGLVLNQLYYMATVKGQPADYNRPRRRYPSKPSGYPASNTASGCSGFDTASFPRQRWRPPRRQCSQQLERHLGPPRRMDHPSQSISSKRFSSWFLRTCAGSKTRPFMAR
jgi:hypothetical protein